MDQRTIRFVGRMKKTNAKFKVIKNMKVSDDGVLEDQEIQFSSPKASNDCLSFIEASQPTCCFGFIPISTRYFAIYNPHGKAKHRGVNTAKRPAETA